MKADNIYERWRIATIVHCPSLPQLLLRNIVVSLINIRAIVQIIILIIFMIIFIIFIGASLTKIKTIIQMIILIAMILIRLL